MARVLVVDDEIFIRDFLKAFIQKQFPDVEVVGAGNGDEAWDAARAQHMDLVTVDINMPFVNGVELIKKFKADPDLREVPLVVVAAQAGDTELAKQLSEFGVLETVAKVDVTAAGLEQNPLTRLIKTHVLHEAG